MIVLMLNEDGFPLFRVWGSQPLVSWRSSFGPRQPQDGFLCIHGAARSAGSQSDQWLQWCPRLAHTPGKTTTLGNLNCMERGPIFQANSGEATERLVAKTQWHMGSYVDVCYNLHAGLSLQLGPSGKSTKILHQPSSVVHCASRPDPLRSECLFFPHQYTTCCAPRPVWWPFCFGAVLPPKALAGTMTCWTRTRYTQTSKQQTRAFGMIV